jgi:hypothetical protein
MKMIDPNSTLSQVQTSIKSVMKQKKATMRILLDGESKLPSEILELIGLLSK